MTTPSGYSFTYLSLQAVAPATAQRYSQAVLQFLQYCSEHRLTLNSISDLDAASTCYCVDLFFASPDHRCRQRVANLKQGLATFWPPAAAKGALPSLSRSLKGWSKLVRSKPWAPIHHELAALIAVQLVKLGRRDMGLAVMLGFSALLRISECVGLFVEDVCLVGDRRLGALSVRSPASLRLRKTKTGDNFFAQLRHSDVAQLLADHVKTRPAGAKLFDFTVDQLRTQFARACRLLQLNGRYVFHGVRHGGATDAYAKGMSIEDVLFLGRWAATKSARHYVQFGRSQLIALHVSQSNADRGALFASRLVQAFALAASQARPQQGWRRRL